MKKIVYVKYYDHFWFEHDLTLSQIKKLYGDCIIEEVGFLLMETKLSVIFSQCIKLLVVRGKFNPLRDKKYFHTTKILKSDIIKLKIWNFGK